MPDKLSNTTVENPLAHPVNSFVRSFRDVSECLPGDLLQEQLSYWMEELAGSPTKLDLPTDKPRPAKSTLGHAIQIFEFPEELRAQLECVCRMERVTLFATLLTGFAALMHRYSGQDDLLIGTPVSEGMKNESGRTME